MPALLQIAHDLVDGLLDGVGGVGRDGLDHRATLSRHDDVGQMRVGGGM